MKQANIIGTGSYLPEKVLTNHDLEKLVQTTDEWIVTRTGMKERRIADEQEFTSTMGLKAAIHALEEAQMDASELDLILVATLTPDYLFPSTACLLQAALKAERSAAMDVQAACSGYIYALTVAKAFVESGLYKNVLVVASEKLSSIVDYQDRNTCVLFGDGAAACVVSDRPRGRSGGLWIRNAQLGSDGHQKDILLMPAGGCRMPASNETVAARLHSIKMEGKEVFKHAVRRMEASCKDCLDAANIKEEEISWLVPHQANTRIIEAIAKRFNVPMERVFLTIHKYGNTSASSIGIALDELLRENKVKSGDNVLLTAFGAGLTWGSMVFTHV